MVFEGFQCTAYKSSIKQWLSLALSIQMKQKLQKFSQHLDEIQRTQTFLSPNFCCLRYKTVVLSCF